jgi:hypothetical protein
MIGTQAHYRSCGSDLRSRRLRREAGGPGVEERSMLAEGGPEGLLDGMEVSMLGMSSDNPDENSGRRKPKVSWGRLVRPGLVGT